VERRLHAADLLRSSLGGEEAALAPRRAASTTDASCPARYPCDGSPTHDVDLVAVTVVEADTEPVLRDRTTRPRRDASVFRCARRRRAPARHRPRWLAPRAARRGGRRCRRKRAHAARRPRSWSSRCAPRAVTAKTPFAPRPVSCHVPLGCGTRSVTAPTPCASKGAPARPPAAGGLQVGGSLRRPAPSLEDSMITSPPAVPTARVRRRPERERGHVAGSEPRRG